MDLKGVVDVLNNVNSVLLIVTGMGINKLYQKFKKWRNRDVEDIEAKVENISELVPLLIESNLALSHDKLYTYCTNFLARGYVTVGELDNLEYLFTSYKALGGNGTGETLYERVKDLPIKNQGEC